MSSGLAKPILQGKEKDSDADRQLLQRDLSALERWEKAWQMSFNPTKCVMLRISSKKKRLVRQPQLHGHTLEVVDASKYLGVALIEDLSWDKRIQNTIRKANKTIGFLRRNLSTHPVRTYKTMVHPILEYSSTV